MRTYTERFWDKVLESDKVVIKNGIAYQMTDKAVDGGFGGASFNLMMRNGFEYRNVGLWCNGPIPLSMHVKDNCERIERC